MKLQLRATSLLVALVLGALLTGGAGASSSPLAVDLGTLGGSSSFAVAVNGGGQVVGLIQGLRNANGDPVNHAFSWTQAGGMVDLGTLGGTNSSAAAVNASGQVVGYSNTAGDAASHAFSWTQAGGMVDLGTFGGAVSGATAVNASGQVVGNSSTAFDAETHAFSWTQAGGMGRPRHPRRC